MYFKIETKRSGWDADNVDDCKRILRQIQSSYDNTNSGKGYGIKVTINGVTHTIYTWLTGHNSTYYLEIIGNPNSHFNKSKNLCY